jgi:heparan-alpha-glucosaminide N-acetyltransferase
MILVDDAGGFIPAINHSPWNGVNLADFVMPFFLFIVGVALALAYKVPVSCYMLLFFPHFISEFH